MPRPVVISDRVIVNAARKVFLAHGYQGSTRDVARLAGISEGSIFKRFKTKTDLFLAAMDMESMLSSSQERLLASVGSAGIRQTLIKHGETLLKRLQIIVPRMLMFNACGVVFAKGCKLSRPAPPVQHIRCLTHYFQAEIKCGRLRMGSPEVQAHIFVGSLAHYVICETLFQYRSATPSVFVRQVTDTILADADPSREKHVCAPQKGKKGNRRK